MSIKQAVVGIANRIAAAFRSESVDALVSGMERQVQRLTAAAERLEDKAEAELDNAFMAADRSRKYRKEAERAARVASRVADLIR